MGYAWYALGQKSEAEPEREEATAPPVLM